MKLFFYYMALSALWQTVECCLHDLCSNVLLFVALQASEAGTLSILDNLLKEFYSAGTDNSRKNEIGTFDCFASLKKCFPHFAAYCHFTVYQFVCQLSRVRTILAMADFPISINRVAEIGRFDLDFCTSFPVNAKYNIVP